MKFVKVVALLLLLVVAVGLIRGWFGVSHDREPADDKVKVEFTVDSEKVREDVETVQETTERLGERVTEEVEELKNP